MSDETLVPAPTERLYTAAEVARITVGFFSTETLEKGGLLVIKSDTIDEATVAALKAMLKAAVPVDTPRRIVILGVSDEAEVEFIPVTENGVVSIETPEENAYDLDTANALQKGIKKLLGKDVLVALLPQDGEPVFSDEPPATPEVV